MKGQHGALSTVSPGAGYDTDFFQWIILVMHLLKWEFQPELRCSSWTSTIGEQRVQIQLILQDSPSLRRLPSKEAAAIYRHALKQAIAETGLDASCFPPSCPYTAEQMLDGDFFPDAR